MNNFKSIALAGLSIGVSALAFSGVAHAGKTLDGIKQRGQVICLHRDLSALRTQPSSHPPSHQGR